MAETTGRLYHIPAADCTAATAQTAGMQRFAAISGDRVGARAIWMGRSHVAPATGSGPHHHGESETGIFVVSGHPVFLYREGDRVVELQTAPGDFIYVPPFVPHLESNPAPAEEAVVVVARTTQEAIVVNLEQL